MVTGAAEDAAIGIVTLAPLLVLSAVAFTRLTDYPAAHIPGSRRSPEQLAKAFD